MDRYTVNNIDKASRHFLNGIGCGALGAFYGDIQ